MSEPARGPRAPRLLIVTDRTATGGRPLPDVIASALAGLGGGLPADRVAVQLREKDLPGRALFELATALRALTARAGVALYVNDRVDVALATGADGVHLGGGALSPTDVARLAPGLAIALSTHGPADVAAASAVAGDRLAFVVCGPVRETPSKRRYGPPIGLNVLADAAKVGVPVIAIGGLEPGDVSAVLRAGAAGVACIRAVMSAPDPAATVGAFCQELK